MLEGDIYCPSAVPLAASEIRDDRFPDSVSILSLRL